MAEIGFAEEKTELPIAKSTFAIFLNIFRYSNASSYTVINLKICYSPVQLRLALTSDPLPKKHFSTQPLAHPPTNPPLQQKDTTNSASSAP